MFMQGTNMATVFVLCAILACIVSLQTSNLPGFEPRILYTGPTSNSHLKSLDEFIDFSKYHHFNDLTDILKFTNRTYSNFSYLYSIGKSVQGRELWVMKLSTSPGELFTVGKPSVKLIANIHGNEPVGREMLLHLMKYILLNYETDSSIQNLLDNTDIHLLFSMNPDGFENSVEGDCDSVKGRYNANGFDLNRNFPDYFKPSRNIQTQPETSAIKRWIQTIPFTLSASLHGGALVASYPFDNRKGPSLPWDASEASISPDDDVFRHLSLVYSQNHFQMNKGQPCSSDDKGFRDGITNGAEWYPLTGGMQDYNYAYYGCMELTLELACCKYPRSNELRKHWDMNRNALIDYVRQAHRGVYGIVKDSYGYPITNATLYVRNRKMSFKTNSAGEFRRVLLPGKYTLEVYAQNYENTEARVIVEDKYQPTSIEIVLEPGQSTHQKPIYRPVQVNNESDNFLQSVTNGLSNIFKYFK